MNYRIFGFSLLGAGTLTIFVGHIAESATSFSSAFAFTLIVLSFPFLVHGKATVSREEAPQLPVDIQELVPTSLGCETDEHVGQTQQVDEASSFESDAVFFAGSVSTESGDTELARANVEVDVSMVFPFFY